MSDSYPHVSGMLDRTGLDWLLAMFDLEIYFDDSGTHKESDIAIAACYVATKEQWDGFYRNWNEILTEEECPYFHMADFMLDPARGHKPYCTWDEAKRERVYRRLSSVIRLRAQHGFAIAVPKDVYDLHAPADMKVGYAKDHYAFAVKCCLGLIWRWRMDNDITGLMQYVFDTVPKGKGVKGEIMQIWEEMDDDPSAAEKFGFTKQDGYQFQDKKIFKPLQAADVLAWHMYDYVQNIIKKGLDEMEHMRDTFMRLRDGRPMTLGWFTEAKLKEFIKETLELQKRTGTKTWGTQFRKDRTAQDAKRRISKNVGLNEAVVGGPAQRDQSQTGSGERSKKAEEN